MADQLPTQNSDYFFNTCVALGCFVRKKQKSKQKRENSSKCDLGLKNLASSCPFCHKQYNVNV